VEVSSNGETHRKGILLGLNSEGALRLRTSAGTEIAVHVGDVRLRLESGKIG
jgi:hypothetical protein